MEVLKLPRLENGERVETGAVQFGDDWPGVFIRGDTACHYNFSLNQFLAMHPVNEDAILQFTLKDLQNLLASCRVTSSDESSTAGKDSG